MCSRIKVTKEILYQLCLPMVTWSQVEYQNISREFGYSETSFVYYSIEQKALNVRSFTPTGVEVDGAGHNLLGAVCAALLKGNTNI